MEKLKEFIIFEGSSIKEAIEVIDKTASQIALVVSKNKLVGVVTDGDIRRALLKGAKLNIKVKNIMQKKYKFLHYPATKNQALLFMKKETLKQIPVIDKNKKLIDLYLLEKLIKINKLSNEVVIMAGGKGKRLGELTRNCPKPMLRIGNRPMMEIIFQQCIDAGFKNFYFSVFYLKKKIKNYFKSGKDWDANIKYLEENNPLGTAGCLSLLPKNPKKPILIINGDVLTKIDYDHLIKFHNENKCDITICVRENKTKIPYGILNLNDLEVIDLEEKPELIHFINAGIYFINPKIISLIPKKKFFDMTDLISTAKRKKFIIKAFLIHEYWKDVGFPEVFENIKKDKW